MEKNCRIIICLILLFVHLSSCKKPESTFENEVVLNNLYTASVETLKIQGQNYILETYLYRDFFPGIGFGRTTSLIADVYLVNTDSLTIPSNIDIKKLYLINDQSIWASAPVPGVQPYLPGYKLNKFSRDGPKWDTDIYVDAIIMIVNSLTKEEYYLIAEDQYINRVE